MTKPVHGDAPPCLCPSCGELLDAWGATEAGPPPQPGEASICVYCGVLAITADDLRLRLPNKDELAELLADPDISMAMIEAMLAIERRQFPIGAPHGKGTKQ